MKTLQGKFWTVEQEMIAAIEENGYDVMSIEDDTIEVMDMRESDDKTENYSLVRTNRTIAIGHRIG